MEIKYVNCNANVNASTTQLSTKLLKLCSYSHNNDINKSYRKRIFSKIGLESFLSQNCADQVYIENDSIKRIDQTVSNNKKWETFVKPQTGDFQHKYKRIENSIKQTVYEDSDNENKTVFLYYPFIQSITTNLQNDYGNVPFCIAGIDQANSEQEIPKEAKCIDEQLELHEDQKISAKVRISKICNRELDDVTMDLMLESMTLFDSCNLNKLTQNLISEEKARLIKLLLTNLLKDLDATKRQLKLCKNQSQMTSKTCLNDQELLNEINPKTPHTDPPKESSISDIIRQYNETFSKSVNKLPFPTEGGKLAVKIKKSNCGPKNKDDTVSPKVISPDQVQKTLILNPFDEVLKSYYSMTDRRLLAVAKKVNCTIEIVGPLKTLKCIASVLEPRDKATYKCLITGENISVIDKCLRCIRETFPTTTIREAKCF